MIKLFLFVVLIGTCSAEDPREFWIDAQTGASFDDTADFTDQGKEETPFKTINDAINLMVY